VTVEAFGEPERVDFAAAPQPMSLAQEPAGIGAGLRAEIEQRLAGGCYCGSGAAQMTRRTNRGGAISLALQCLRCGAGIGGAIRRELVPDWERLPAWDDALRLDYATRRQAEAEAALAQARADMEARAQERRVGRDAYSAWLRTSRDWAGLRALVMRRAGGRCEACLTAKAEHVHHLTYALGRLPPAWELRAVCAPCHGRLHSGADQWTGAAAP